jgi:hypothetical protein
MVSEIIYGIILSQEHITNYPKISGNVHSGKPRNARILDLKNIVDSVKDKGLASKLKSNCRSCVNN